MTEADQRLSILDRIGIQGVRVMAFGIGALALLLDLTGWFTIVGGGLAVVGCGYALMSPRGRLRTAALTLNGIAFAVAAVIYASLLLYV